MAKKKPARSAGTRRNKTRRLIAPLIVLLSATVIVYILGSYHFLQTNAKMYVVRKVHFGFKDTYVDMRKWSALDLFYHPEIKQAIIKVGGQNLLTQLEQTFSQVEE
ncbi:MAG: hypothetical protein N3A72_08280 [bacterium]|nr:hypothetical protein [bacterium]